LIHKASRLEYKYTVQDAVDWILKHQNTQPKPNVFAGVFRVGLDARANGKGAGLGLGLRRFLLLKWSAALEGGVLGWLLFISSKGKHAVFGVFDVRV
jgi:hypothetical protein